MRFVNEFIAGTFIFLMATLLMAAVVNPPAPPTTKWDSSTGCTTITMGDSARTVQVMVCKGADGTGGTIRIPDCPTTLSLIPANSFCGMAGGKGILVKGSTTAYTLVP